MTPHEYIQQSLHRVKKGQQTDEDITFLRRLLLAGDRQLAIQLGKYNVNIGEGRDIHIGDTFGGLPRRGTPTYLPILLS
ncbi:hypothetical protein [Nostoc sphaeroides]|uniref:WD40 repeat domain-containing protein n=1 Tax=Nostoc sphaeroides CCNUC1 TaxID=2653204 RepID=A0A5P8WAD6_9NOSO|nr:hypothetical protein [Nostoc sphaeroides]QFS49755.1 WD40 repeat domain-containing protein [Nostoc sphaeroides CCNUC1]